MRFDHDGRQRVTPKIALVTGANKGIGYEIAAQLAALDMTVLLAARDPERGRQAVEALRATGGDVHPIMLDVTLPTTATTAAGQIERRFGRLDILINNAGISGNLARQSPGTASLDTVRAVFDTNVFGVITVTNAMLPLLRRSPPRGSSTSPAVSGR
ncbi:SDR family NAD(P)-dependent oxidoreductase [Nonomuraea antimicrobica]